MKKNKNKILELITVTAFFVCIVSAMFIAQAVNEWIPVLAFLASFSWISLFFYVNRIRLAGARK